MDFLFNLINNYNLRRICDEDEDLAEITPDTVPDEVREWLAATFTRQTVGTQKRGKPKFKSVANAIRTGIFFDKIFRRTQNVQAPIPAEYRPALQVMMYNCLIQTSMFRK